MGKASVSRWRFLLFQLPVYLLLVTHFNNSLGQVQPKPASTIQPKTTPAQTTKAAPAAKTQNIVINPAFPGGNDSLENYIFTHIQVPDSLLLQDISGTIYFSFYVEVDGKIDKIKIEKGPPSKGWDSATIKCIRHMPNWIPGKVNGKPTAMRYFLPVFIPPGHELFNMPDSANAR